MKFGWMTLSMSPSAADDLACVHQQLEQGVLAEAMGFDYLWLTEHNFTGECAYADPIPFAGALAARTSRARLGFAVIQMALHHPVRLAIQLAVLDNLSRGRLDVGIGRGSAYNEYEYVGFGLRSDDSRDRMEEAIERADPRLDRGAARPRRANSSRSGCRPSGRARCQRPHPPIWRSVISVESLVECGRAGVPVMMSRVPNARIPERLARYREGLEARGHDAATRRRRLAEASVWRFLYVAESDAQAEDDVHEATLHYRQHMHHVRERVQPGRLSRECGGDEPVDGPGRLPSGRRALRARDGRALRNAEAGGRADRGAARRPVSVTSCARRAGAGLAHDKVVASLKRFGEHVAPAFRDA